MQVLGDGRFGLIHVCNDCGCTYKFFKTDVKQTSMILSGVTSDFYYSSAENFVCCPQCDYKLVLTDKDIKLLEGETI